MSGPAPLIIGVRHHSPACARLVAARIMELRPAYVLIEGPADFNGRLDELSLGHQPPVAIYSYLATGKNHRASWTPFLDYSPEWQGLQHAAEVGAEARFIDLPAWHQALAEVGNRYADAGDAEELSRAEAYEGALCAELRVSGRDALWDHLFENEDDPDLLEKSLARHFEHLRQGDPGSPENQAREEMMAAWLAWAQAQGRGRVLVICGGYHAPALRKLWPGFTFRPGDQPPAVPAPDAETADGPTPAAGPRCGSYLVPYSFKRLDAFQGYASGMPSPAYYQWLWEEGPEGAGLRALELIFQRLRAKKHPASTADLKAVHAAAVALAAWRGHHFPLRSDYLDAALGGLVKTALESPPPWDYRGLIRPGTDPLLVEIMAVMAGDRRGRLDPRTPQPPLVASVREELKRLGLDMTGQVKINLLASADLARSHCLHALNILEIPGFARLSGPDLALSGTKTESWELSRPLEQSAALIEAGLWGATLAGAAQNRVESRLREAAGGLAELAGILNQAVLAGLGGVSDRALEILAHSVAAEGRFEAFGPALAIVFPLWRHGLSLNRSYAPTLKIVLEAAYDRMLWLLEPPVSLDPGHFLPHLRSQIELARLVREAQAGPAAEAAENLDLNPDRALAVWGRKAADPEAAPVSRGAALGALISLEGLKNQAAADRLLDSLAPETMGEALMGLLALGREVLARAEDFLGRLDERVEQLSPHDFTLALPALRSAFGWLSSPERLEVARSLVALRGEGSALGLTQKMAGDPLLAARALATEQRLADELAGWGLVIRPAGEGGS